MSSPERLDLAAGPCESRSGLPQTPCSIDDPQVIEQVRQYRAALLEGRRPHRESLLEKYPQITAELSACLDALELVRGVVPQLNGQDGLPDRGAPALPPLGSLGDFRLLREIGRGGMGIVYEAEQLSLHRRVALKVLPFAAVLDCRQLQRFQNEAVAAASLKHPHIVQVYSVGCERGIHYYAMEYVQGHTLADVIAQLRQRQVTPQQDEPREPSAVGQLGEDLPSGRFAPAPERPGAGEEPAGHESDACEQGSTGAETKREPQALLSTASSRRDTEFFRSVANWGIQAAEALEHAHQLGVVHRDIKPSNLLIDGDGHLWVTDFGLAQITAPSPLGGEGRGEGANLTMTGDVLGTLRYMSPEQAAGRSRVLDCRTDIYSLGVTLYELLTLRPAFAGEDRQSVLRQIAEEEPPQPRSVNRVIPKDLETIVLKAMAKEPQARYATTRDLADDLKRFLADEPIRARRRTLADRAAKWARRHQPIVWASVAVLLIALAASLVSVLLIAGAYEQEKTQRLTAQRSEARALTAEDLAKQQERLARKQEQLANQQRELAVAQRDLSERNLYVAHMRLAAQDWESGQIDRLHEMLDGHVPRPDRPDLRGWEWYYYLSLCHSDLTTFRGHNGGVHSCAWSPDGKRLASGGHDGAVKIWNAATGQEILTLRGHQGVRCVDWSADGKRLASGGSDRTVRIWDEATGKQLFTFTGFAREVRSVAWSPDGQRLAAGDRVRTGSPHKLYTVRVWDAAEGRELLDLKGRASAPLAWSPDGKRLATGIGGEPPGVRVWDVAEGREVLSFSPAGWSLFVLAWSPDGKRLASGQYNSLAQVWDLTTGQEVVKLRHRGSVEGLAWSRDSKHLATASRDQTISVWDPTTGEEVFRLHGHRGWVSDVAWSPEGSRLASAGNDGTVKIWDAQRKQDAVHIDRVGASHLAWSPKGDRLASAGGDKVRIWDPSKGEELLSLDIPAALVAWSLVAWSPDGRQLAAAGGSRTAIVDTQTGKQVATLQTGGVKRMCWSPDGTRLAVTHHGGGPVDVWDVRTGQLLLSRRAPGKFDDPSGLDWSPDGSRIATGEGGMVRIWDAATGKAFLALRGHAGSFIWSVAWSPDGKRLASGGWDQIVKVWDASRGRELLSLAGHTADVFTVDWSPDGTRLASTGWDATIKIWDAFTGDQMISLLGSFIAWSPDGHRVATIADPEGTITIYDASAGYAFANSPEYPRDLYQARARDYWRSGEFDKAIAEYGELIRIDPKSATGYTSRAALYRRKGQFDKAIADYDQVIRLDPQSAAAYFNRAQAHLEKSDFDRAPADLSKAVELAPDHALFWYWRALARVAAGRLDEYRRDCAEMLRHFGATEDADAAHWTAWSCTLAPDAAADWSVPLALAKKAAKGDPDSIQYMITHGAVLYRAGRVQQAIQRLMDAEPLHQALDPTLPSSPAYAWFYLAMAHHRLGHGDEAKKFLNKAAAAWMDEETREPKAPTAPRPAWNRRLTLKLLSDEAHTLLKTDAARLPESPGKRAEACYVRGRAHAEKGELAQAIAAYDEAIKLDPHWVEYYGDRGNLHAQKGQLDLAIADFTEAIRLDPSDPQARVNRGSAYIDKGEPQKAAADFKEALRVNPLCAQQCFARAEDCRKANQRERALAEYRKAMRLDLLYTRTYLTHSALIGVDRLDQALAEFRQLIQVRTDVPPAWLHGASCWLPAMIRGTDKAPGIVFVSDMPWVRSTCGWQYGTSPPGYLRSATGALGGFPSLKVAWSHAFQDATPADCVLDISGHKFTLFKAHVGPLDFHGSVQFQVLVDAKVKQETPVLRPGELEAICVDVAGAKEVVLRLLNGGDGNAHDRAAWGFARFIPAGAEDPLEEPPAELHSATDANAALFLAEVHWRLDHKNLARRWYDKAAQWMDKNKTEAEILQRYRAEAAKLLGIPEKPSTAKTKPEKPR